MDGFHGYRFLVLSYSAGARATEPKVGAPEGERGPVRRIVVTDCSIKVDSARRKLHPSTRPHLISTCPAPRRATWRLGQKMADEPFNVELRKAPSLRPSRVVIYASHTASNGYHSLSESRAVHRSSIRAPLNAPESARWRAFQGTDRRLWRPPVGSHDKSSRGLPIVWGTPSTLKQVPAIRTRRAPRRRRFRDMAADGLVDGSHGPRCVEYRAGKRRAVAYHGSSIVEVVQHNGLGVITAAGSHDM